MRLKVFDMIDGTLALLEKNDDLYHRVEQEIRKTIYAIFEENREYIVDLSSRVKSKESLREKIIRNRFYMECGDAQTVLDDLSDLIGVTIECRFIEEEYKALFHLRSVLTKVDDDGFHYSEKFPKFHLECASQQPQIQKNGFAIYRIDGYYIEDEQMVNFELQIKALVHSFWGEIEHKLVYKNTNFYVYDEFMKDLLASINANLSITDRQLNIVYNQMRDLSQSGSSITEGSFEKQISKAINDLFAKKMNESLGFTLNIKNTSTILGHYLFIKDIRYDGSGTDRISTLFHTFKKLNSIHIDFENAIDLDMNYASSDIFTHTLGTYLLSVINHDYDWFVFFKMLFAIEPGNDMQDFNLFLDVIKNYLVDNYWLNTSFVKLSMEESEMLHNECAHMLAESLIEIGTIKIVYDEKMLLINKAFVRFIEELEQRVISYKDFSQYRHAYYEEWMKKMREIFA